MSARLDMERRRGSARTAR